MVCCRHQLRDVDLQNVLIMLDDGSHAVTSGGATLPASGLPLQSSDAYDLAAFDFSDPCESHPSLRSKFFKLDKSLQQSQTHEVISLIGYGFPTSEQDYDIYENNRLHIRKGIMLAQLDGVPSDSALLRGHYSSELLYEPDGLSGGPVFSIIRRGSECAARFAGMTNRASKSHFHFIKLQVIGDFLTLAAGET